VIERPGTAVLYREATPLERALADSDAEALLSINTRLIQWNWEPYKVQARNLNHLGFAYGVTLWEDEWSEDDKRQWVADQWEFKARIGTRRALDMALGINGFTLNQVVAPPQAFYASPMMPVEEFNTWIRLMPQIRVKLATRSGRSYGDVWYSDDGCVGRQAPWIDVGPTLYGRQAVIRYANGREVDLLVSRIERTIEHLPATDYERVHLPGRSTMGFFESDHAGEHYVEGDEVSATILSMALARTYEHETAQLYLSSLVPGLDPLSPVTERNSDIGDGGWLMFAGDFAHDTWSYAGEDPAANLLADRVYLHDPAVAVPMTLGVSFAGYDRVGIAPHTAELLVDLHTEAGEGDWYAQDGAAEAAFASPHDSKQIDRGLRAVVAAKALRDDLHVNFAPTRPLRAGDVITESTRILDQVPTML
jgi:phage tail P2-like protein